MYYKMFNPNHLIKFFSFWFSLKLNFYKAFRKKTFRGSTQLLSLLSYYSFSDYLKNLRALECKNSTCNQYQIDFDHVEKWQVLNCHLWHLVNIRVIIKKKLANYHTLEKIMIVLDIISQLFFCFLFFCFDDC